MAEVDFERRLERLFDEAPELPDAADFAQGVERRLNRGWNTRRWLIGVAGVVGGLIGAGQLIMSNVVQRMEAASEQSAKVISVGMNEVAPRLEWLSVLPSGAGLVWIASALAVVALGFALTRVIGEI